jgi:hypothetical protein
MKNLSGFFTFFIYSVSSFGQPKETQTFKENPSKPIADLAYNLSVGYVYCEPNRVLLAQEQISKLKEKYSKLQIRLKTIIFNVSTDSAISLSLQTCEKLINKDSVYAVILDNSGCSNSYYLNNDKLMTLAAVSFTSAYYQIPVISLYNRESEFSDNVIYIDY